MDQNSISAHLYFDNRYHLAVGELMRSMCGPFKAAFISDSEHSSKSSLHDASLLAQFADKNRARGFCLHSEKYRASISYREEMITFLFECSDDECAEFILEQAARYPVSYGFACRDAERESKNRIVLDRAYGTHELWVGRDFTQYLPGLYWLNIIPDELMSRHELSAAELLKVCIGRITDTDGALFQLHQNSEDWRQFSAVSTAWCAGAKHCFDKSKVEQMLKKTKNFIEVSSVTREFK